LVAAMQAAIFTRVEGEDYNSMMITGSMRQAIEGIFTVAIGGRPPGALRRSGIFMAVCVAFGLGAAVGAFATKTIPHLTLGLPVFALLLVLLRCAVEHKETHR
jgi:uncharacterized membrane protein YoaK (UPF0700 family)